MEKALLDFVEANGREPTAAEMEKQLEALQYKDTIEGMDVQEAIDSFAAAHDG